MVQDVLCHRGTQDLEGLVKACARLFGVDPETALFIGKDAAANTQLEPSARLVIEHAHFFSQAQRMIKRQEIGHRFEADA